MAKARNNKKMKPSKIGTSSIVKPNSSVVERATCISPYKQSQCRPVRLEVHTSNPQLESGRSELSFGCTSADTPRIINMNKPAAEDKSKKSFLFMKGIHAVCKDEKDTEEDKTMSSNCDEPAAAVQFSRQHSFRSGGSRGNSMRSVNPIELRSLPEEHSVREHSNRALRYLIPDSSTLITDGAL